MNILQGLKSEHTFCVTLNQKEDINPATILGEFIYHHPIFSADSIKAQKRRPLICGVNNTHFAGAYWHSGFHEDGVRSAVEIANKFECFIEPLTED
jgi:predicted NAD/FAD-binding protein